MSVVLALSAAMVFGSADFLGGLASRRIAALAAALGSQVCGLGVLVVALPFFGGHPTPVDLALGAGGGLFGGLGLVLIYRSLARGPMSIVAPTAALSAAIVPVAAGVALGERPGLGAAVGIAVAFVAVALITRERRGPDVAAIPLGVLGTSLAAGACVGIFFVFLHQTGHDAGLWPLLSARLASIVLLSAIAGAQGTAVRLPWSSLRTAVVSGGLDMCANVLYLLAVRRGMLAVVSALTALYPASTVLLAQAVLSERMRKVQVAGLGVAVLAAVLIAA